MQILIVLMSMKNIKCPLCTRTTNEGVCKNLKKTPDEKHESTGKLRVVYPYGLLPDRYCKYCYNKCRDKVKNTESNLTNNGMCTDTPCHFSFISF